MVLEVLSAVHFNPVQYFKWKYPCINGTSSNVRWTFMELDHMTEVVTYLGTVHLIFWGGGGGGGWDIFFFL